ncbi:indole-3-glycerol phosphate synthase TrpC [Streptococcus sciuri]|uniref:Indole-3-glycerol phosphate synthase n=1 Tax=Streptococcus sciuri TaxID=2973939 RepID=A0ABT2F6E5_9STRE|nr:indole-3-glycerol phosphate synthase TrpC [Streptococcus sciuri]MCS4487410.1 indole-3-glycerol phosphate synthase TrpC [Streptococcus sciuri]
MSDGAFLERILAIKEQENAQLVVEKVKPLRKTYSFYDYVKTHNDRIHIIAEVKKASPSLGAINMDVDLLDQARCYETAGASMISVLTDEPFFKGHIDYLRMISESVAIPTLQKDFIIDEKQIIRGANAGATVILLIVAALSKKRLCELFDFATSLGMEVLVETHNLIELEIAHQIGAKIIGINNRDLTTFKTDLQTSIDLIPYLRSNPVYISESAIVTREDVKRLVPSYDGILCGTTLMQSDTVAAKIKELAIDKG